MSTNDCVSRHSGDHDAKNRLQTDAVLLRLGLSASELTGLLIIFSWIYQVCLARVSLQGVAILTNRY